MAFVVAYNPPSVFNDTKVTLSGIKGAVLIGAGISMMIYLVNLFVRLCISSFHLARDAREGVGSIQIQSVLGRTWPAKGQIGGPDWPNRRYRAAKQFGRGRHQHEKPSGDLLRP